MSEARVPTDWAYAFHGKRSHSFTREVHKVGSPLQGTHSNYIFKFLVFSLSNSKFSWCQFMWFVTITYTKLTWQTYQALKQKWRFSWQILKYLLPLESGNLQLEQTKFPEFSLTGIFLVHFRCFPCAVGTLLLSLSIASASGIKFLQLIDINGLQKNPRLFHCCLLSFHDHLFCSDFAFATFCGNGQKMRSF